MEHLFTKYKKRIFIVSALIILISGFFISQLDYREEYAFISMFFMIFITLPTYYFFIIKHNKFNAIKVLIILSLFSMVIETIGILTGFPYSFFTYTNNLGPKIFVIPITLSFGFVPLVIASWYLIEKFKLKNLFIKIFYGALILILFDLVLDPAAVVLNFWEWEINGLYYGVPLVNYLGWLFTGLISMFIIFYFMKEKPKSDYLIYTALMGNLFFTMVVIMNLMIIPSIIGIIISFYLCYIIKKEKN